MERRLHTDTSTQLLPECRWSGHNWVPELVAELEPALASEPASGQVSAPMAR